MKSKHMTVGSIRRLALVAASMVVVLLGIDVARAVRGASVSSMIGGVAGAQQSDPPLIGTGVPMVGSAAPRSGLSSNKAGSLLFFPRYTSSANSPSRVNTIITLTNTNPRDGVTLRLTYFSECQQAVSRFVNLSANQTQTLLASLDAPGRSGYLIAAAVSAQGIPTQFNWVIGSASLRDEQGHVAAYNAIGVAKRSVGDAPFRSDANEATINFNDQDYDRLPQVVAIDQLRNQDPAKESGPESVFRTDVAIFSPPASLGGAAGSTMKLTAIAYDQSGRPYPQVIDTGCGLTAPVSGIWTSAPITDFIEPGRPGWASFSGSNNNRAVPLMGLSLTDGVGTASFSARHMQVLRRLDSFAMAVPVVRPGDGAAASITANQPEAEGGALGASEMKAGSILVYPRFATGQQGDSRLALTNTHPTQKARVRVFFNGLAETPATTETIITVLPNQTLSIDPGATAPNQKGWVMAVAIDARALPLNFNFLIGSVEVREKDGARNGYGALAIARNAPGVVPRNSDIETADLNFNDIEYDRLPNVVGFNGVPNQTDNTSTIGYARASSDLKAAPAVRGLVQVSLTDHLLGQFAGVFATLEIRLGSATVASSTPPAGLTRTITVGQRGWLKMMPNNPIFAWGNNVASVPFTAPGTFADYQGGFGGWTTPHILTVAGSFVTKTMALNPNNEAPTADFEAIEPQIEARSAKGTTVRLDGRLSSDPNAEDPLSYKWYDNDTVIATVPLVDYAFTKGLHIIKLVVTDGNGVNSEPKTHILEVRDTTPPAISGLPTNITKITNSSLGATLQIPTASAYDMVDGWITAQPSPQSNTLFRIGRTTVNFTARDSSGNTATASITVTVTKGSQNLPTVGGVPGNKAPTLPNISDQYLLVGKVRSLLLQAADENNEPVSFELSGGPTFARLEKIDPISRRATLVLSPKEGDRVFSSNVRVIVRDYNGGIFSTLPFRIQISDVENNEKTTDDSAGGGGGGGGDTGGGGGNPAPSNKPPTARIAPLPATIQANTNKGATVQLDASPSSDPESDPLTYTWRNNDQVIAEGAMVSAVLGVGRNSVTLTVNDGKGGVSTSDPVVVVVTPRQLSVTGITPPRIAFNSTTQMTITGTGFDAGTTVRFDCSGTCAGGSQVTVTLTSVEEDKLTISARTTSRTPTGNRDLYVVAADGTTIRLMRSNYVSQ